MAKVTIFGFAGTGKSSTGKELAGKLGYEFISSGKIFRDMAEEKKMALNDFEVLAAQDKQFDEKLDSWVKNYGIDNENFILESRLAWFFIPDSIKIKLLCDLDARIKRVSVRDGIPYEEALQKTKHREDVIKEKYLRYYGISDFSDDKFDLVIDTTKTPLTQVVSNIEEFISNR